MRRTVRSWWILIELQTKLLLKNRVGLVGSLGLAVISMLIFGTLLGGDDAVALPICVVDRDGSAAAEGVGAAFAANSGVTTEPCQPGEELEQLEDGDLAAVVVLPAGFGEAMTAGGATAQVYYDDGDPILAGQARGAVAAIVGEVNQAASGAPAAVTLETTAVESRVLRQIDWLTPGMVGMMVMWANLAVGATIIVWRERGTLKRLAATPLRPLPLLLTQIVSRVVFSCLQVVILLAIARFVFGVDPVGSYLDVAVIAVVGTLAILAVGFVIASLVPKSEAAQAVSTLVAFPMMFLGSSYFSLETAPAFMRPVIDAMPLTYLNHALRQVMLHGDAVGDLRTDLAVLAAWIVVALLVASRAFRWSTEAR